VAFELSDDQRSLVKWNTKRDGDLFAEACPGAGKTRAIVARFLRLTEEEPRKGVALVSFTNAAIDEVKSRCGERPDALRAPNFVGTFDGFINRYITKPLYVQEHGQTPYFRETWRDIEAASFRMPRMQGPDFQLGWFTFDDQLRAKLIDEWIPRKDAGLLKQVIEAQRDAVERQAGTVISTV
jgi:DNA helicase-2/ATP-dependent DNA helicase PcrA